MTGKIIRSEEAVELSQKFKSSGKKLVLVGGCFDILHVGHISFLAKAKEQGDILMVLLENDKQIKKLKGKDRPINNQQSRAVILAALSSVDYIVLLPSMRDNQSYDDLLSSIKPAIIATTKGDPHRHHKERQAKLCGSIVVNVVDRIKDQSSTKLAEML